MMKIKKNNKKTQDRENLCSKFYENKDFYIDLKSQNKPSFGENVRPNFYKCWYFEFLENFLLSQKL